MMSNLAIIGSVGVPASYGGFETLVEQLIEDSFCCFTVYCSGKHYSVRHSTYKDAKLVYIPLSANGVSSIAYDILSIVHALITGHKKFLLLGTSGAILIPFVRLMSPSSLIITNIDGLEWRRSKWKGVAKWFLKVSESIAVRFSHHVIADNDAIAEHVSLHYGIDCETIAYGGDHALVDPANLEGYPKLDLNHFYALALCRIEPENNVKTILDAFLGCDKDLVFIGNWKTTKYGRNLYSNYQELPNITLLDSIYDVNLLWMYRNYCSAYIHGHSVGGTNPSLVEIMHFSKPVIAFECSYNRASMEGHGRYFTSSAHLRQIIRDLDQDADPKMLEIASRKYTWDIVRRHYANLFLRN